MRDYLILGHRGMLGQMVFRYFKKKGNKVHINPYRFNESERNSFLATCLEYPNAIVVNCIGKIKQKTEDANELLWANALLPLALKDHLLPTQTLIQPSTDCVFNGEKGEPYTLNHKPNAIDTYGWSKYLGEIAIKDRPNTLVMRVSIIGPDQNTEGKGLLAWFLSNAKGTSLKGFSNHLWNGITTLEWCKQLETLLEKTNSDQSYFFQLGTEKSYSKYEMLLLFQEYFNTDYRIETFETDKSIDRRLVPTVISKGLEEQLKDLIAET